MLTNATVSWQQDASGKLIPIANEFDDIYFAQTSGLNESDYVFLQANHLPSRFKHAICHHHTFVIAETGFGTGLNFLATCRLWHSIAKNMPKHHATLQFISTEKFPLTLNDLQTALSAWQKIDDCLDSFAQALIATYPPPLAGCHRRHFTAYGTHIILDLWQGDAADSLSTLAQHPSIGVDAWFLDGFAPSKNSDLWSAALFDCIYKLSKPTTTLATFTAAGVVRRALLAIGATPQKIKGFGHKREMLTATFDKIPPKPDAPSTKRALVIGTGIAGLTTAYSLAKRGTHVTLIDKQAPLAGASGNPRALLSPKLTAISHAHEHFPTLGFVYSQAFYKALTHEQIRDSKADNHPAIFSETGVLDWLLPRQKSQEKLTAQLTDYPSLVKIDHHNTPDTFTALFTSAGLVAPAALAAHILQHPRIHWQQDEIVAISEEDGQVLASSRTHTYHSDCAVICAGVDSEHLDTTGLGRTLYGTRHIRGQVSWLTDSQLAEQLCRDYHPAVKYDGYACTFSEQQKLCVLFGASFIRNSDDCSITESDHRFNVDKLTHALPKLHLSADIPLAGRASIRSQTPDYHPITGRLSPNVYVNTAMGSKGFSFAPLCAEIIASLIYGEALPICPTLLAKISPDRARLQQPLDNR